MTRGSERPGSDRVVLIDSGVDPHHPGIRGRCALVDGGAFGASGRLQEGALRDRLGHGTFVAASILAFRPAIELVSIRVFEESVVCSLDALLKALGAACSYTPLLVNLSVGTTSIDRLRELRVATEELVATGARVVTPASVSGLASYPGGFEVADAVVEDPNQPRTLPVRRTVGGRSVWFSSPNAPSIGDKPPPICRGASLATAHVSGFLAAQARR